MIYDVVYHYILLLVHDAEAVKFSNKVKDVVSISFVESKDFQKNMSTSNKEE